MSPALGLAWSAACYLAFHLVASGLGVLRGGALDIVTLGAAEALVYVLMSLGLLHVHERGANLRSSFGLRPTHPALAPLGFGLGLFLKLPVESLSELVQKFFPLSDEQLVARAALYRVDDLGAVLGLVVVACLTAPLVEELFFRGALYGRIAKVSPQKAGVVAALAFTLVHSDVRQWPALLVVASVLGYLRVASGSLLPCLCLHVAFNAAGVLALVTGAASPTRPLSPSFIWVAASWICVTLLLLLLVRLADDPGAARARAEDRG